MLESCPLGIAVNAGGYPHAIPTRPRGIKLSQFSEPIARLRVQRNVSSGDSLCTFPAIIFVPVVIMLSDWEAQGRLR